MNRLPRDHYSVLGVSRGATTGQMREAYRAKARLLHPDRHIDSSLSERDAAEREMSAVNEAWRVLSDATRRRVYDDAIEPPGTRHYADTTLGLDDDDDLDALDDVAPSGAILLWRGLPWFIIIGVLVLIFVFTAYAGPGSKGQNDRNGPSGSTPATGAASVIDIGDCVVLSGRDVRAVPCGEPNSGQVVAEADSLTGCPVDTRPIIVPGRDHVACITS
jgi:curved DNA-binding protein CbpA